MPVAEEEWVRPPGLSKTQLAFFMMSDMVRPFSALGRMEKFEGEVKSVLLVSWHCA